jgi:hypothetical protein
MPSFTAEQLAALRRAAAARAELIARRKREVDALRQVVWDRIDLLRALSRPPVRAACDPAAVTERDRWLPAGTATAAPHDASTSDEAGEAGEAAALVPQDA